MREAAHRAGINVSTVSRIESGALDPSVGVLDKLLAAYGQRLEVVPVSVASPECPIRLRPGRVLSCPTTRAGRSKVFTRASEPEAAEGGGRGANQSGEVRPDQTPQCDKFLS